MIFNLCLCCDDLHRSAASRLSFRIDFVFLCRDSAIQVHLMALAAPSIDIAIAVQGERGGKLAWPSLSRSPQSPLHLHCNGKVS